MEFNQIKSDNSRNIFNPNEKFIHTETNQMKNYLYPHGHQMTLQMRCFKWSRDRAFRKDIVL